jgi:hypothetical protein
MFTSHPSFCVAAKGFPETVFLIFNQGAQESIPPAYVAFWLAGTTPLFLLVS